MGLHESGQMYLENIYVLLNENGSVRSIDIVEYMGYSKPSVSRAVGLLKNGEYINVDKNGYITLTEKGKREAEKIYERYFEGDFYKNRRKIRKDCYLCENRINQKRK